MNNTAILCIHGFMGHPGEYKRLSELFNSLGYDTYTITLSGHQGTKLKGATRKDWQQDCVDNIEFLKSKGYEKIILVGHSMGGVLASIMSTEYKDYVSKLILIDVAFEYLKMRDGRIELIPSLRQSLKVLKDVNNLEKIHYSPIVSCSLSAMKEFHYLVKEHATDIYKVNCPILFLHGENDSIVPIESIKNIYEKITNDKEFITIKKGSHWILSSKLEDDNYKKITNFLLKTIG